MNHINNYTRPAEGKPAIELSVFYNTADAQEFFEENVQPLVYMPYGHDLCLAFYTDWDSVSIPEYVSDIVSLRDLPEETVVEIASKFDYSPLDELREEFPTLDELRDEVANWHLEDLSDDDYIWLVELPTSKFGVKTTRGYSQGDVCNVIYALDHEPSRDWLDHLFWDAPVYCRVTVDGEDLYLYGKDNYDYDIDKMVESYYGKDAEYVKEWLRDNLPEHPDYL